MVQATVTAGYDGHRGWMNYLAVHPQLQKRGLGRALVEHAERALSSLGCPKLNLQVRSSNADVIDVYRRLGYVQDDVVSLGKRFVDGVVVVRGPRAANKTVMGRQPR